MTLLPSDVPDPQVWVVLLCDGRLPASRPGLVEQACWCSRCRYEDRPCAVRRLRLARVYGSGAAARVGAAQWQRSDRGGVYEAAQVGLPVVGVTARLVREGVPGGDALSIALAIFGLEQPN